MLISCGFMSVLCMYYWVFWTRWVWNKRNTILQTHYAHPGTDVICVASRNVRVIFRNIQVCFHSP